MKLGTHRFAVLNTKSDQNSEDTLIPLINIVFLLLIFFMIAGQMTQGIPDQMQLPATNESAPVESRETIISIDQQGLVTFEKQTMSVEAFISQLENTDHLVIQADRDISAKTLSPLFKLTEKHPQISLSLAVISESSQ